MSGESYLPSPDEIEAACRQIRTGWSESERHSRTQRTPPMLKADYVGIEAAAAVKAEDRRDAMMKAIAAMKA